MELYFGKMSGNSLRSVFALCESKVGFVPHCLDVKGGENRSASYLSINPMGKVPALVDDDVRLWESNAVNLYVADKHPACGLMPEDPAARAGVLRWMFFQSAHVSHAARALFTAMHPGLRAYWGFRGDLATAEATRPELTRYLNVLDQGLDGREWFERSFSLADVALAPHLNILGEAGFDYGPWPSLRGWLDRIRTRPGWRSAHALVWD